MVCVTTVGTPLIVDVKVFVCGRLDVGAGLDDESDVDPCPFELLDGLPPVELELGAGPFDVVGIEVVGTGVGVLLGAGPGVEDGVLLVVLSLRINRTSDVTAGPSSG